MRSIEFCTYCLRCKRSGEKDIVMENENAIAIYNGFHGRSIQVILKHHEEYLELHPQYMLDFNLLVKNSLSYLLKKYGDDVANYSIVHNHLVDKHMSCVIIPTLRSDVDE